jgi:hypothetical protein
MLPTTKVPKITQQPQFRQNLIIAGVLTGLTKVINKVGKSGLKWYEVGKNL